MPLRKLILGYGSCNLSTGTTNPTHTYGITGADVAPTAEANPGMRINGMATVELDVRGAARRWRRGLSPLLVATALWVPTVAAAQGVADTIAVHRGGVGIHALVGAFGGRFDVRGSEGLDVLGGRAGIGFGELLQLTGFYWNSVDVRERDFLADRAWGGEAQLNLNAGFGLTPFLTAGLARVRLDTDTLDAQTAATVGAGLLFPLGPVLIRAAATDYLFGVGGLSGDNGPDETTHNWLFTVGVTAAFGRGRSREPVMVARADPPPPVTRVDTVVILPGDGPLPAAPQRVDTVAIDGAVVRNYQSDRRVEVPLPLEGSVTIRYGPEPSATPAVTVVSGGPALADAPPPGGVSPPPGAAAGGQDPAVQAWLRDLVSAEVAEQLQRQAPGSLTPEQTERVVEAAVATLLARLETAEVQRMNTLRADLRDAFAAQRELLREEVARLETSLLGERQVAERRPPAPDRLVSPLQDREPPAVGRVEADHGAAARADAQIRIALSEVASRHTAFLSTAETDRGPAVVVGDAAFSTGAALVDDGARGAVREIAAILRGEPGRIVFVQGHTDAVGSELSNQRLSELRAEAVRALLVQEGVEGDRLYAIGFGQARPMASNATPAGRALNRRVEIVVGDIPPPLARRNGT